MTEDEVKHNVTAADEHRTAIGVAVFEDPIAQPGLVQLEEPRDQRTDKRVSLTEDRLTKEVLRLFHDEKSFWTIEEIS